MAINTASGYPQFSGGLITPLFSSMFLARFADETISSEITTNDYSGEISQRGDKITFFRVPKIEVRALEKNMELSHDTPEVEPVQMTVDHADYFSVKYDRIDEKQISNFSGLVSEVIGGAVQSFNEVIDPLVLSHQFIEADPFNRGNNAGRISRAYPLGETGAPVIVTTANVNEVLSRVYSVLSENSASVAKQEAFIVLPEVLRHTLFNSELRSGLFLGNDATTPYLTGRLPGNGFMGMKVIISNFLPSVIDPVTGRTCYQVVAGLKNATGFALQLTENRIIDNDPRFFGKVYQGLSVYGYQVFQPRGVVAMYLQV